MKGERYNNYEYSVESNSWIFYQQEGPFIARKAVAIIPRESIILFDTMEEYDNE